MKRYMRLVSAYAIVLTISTEPRGFGIPLRNQEQPLLQNEAERAPAHHSFCSVSRF